MTDLRRTFLWVVFTMSLVLLWDAWNKHTGQPSLFGGARPAATAGSAPAGASVPNAGAIPQVAPAVPPAAATTAVPAAPSAAPASAPAGERIDIATDVLKASFDSTGGTLVRLEMLGYRDQAQPGQNVVLFDRSAKRLYLATSGLVTATEGVKLPNQQTPMVAQPGPRELASGSDELTLRFEGQEGPLKLVKSFTFRRGSYTVVVKHELTNGSDRALAPQLYLQLERDGNPPEGESSLYFTFTGPAVYTEAAKFQKIEFKDIEKGKAEHAQSASDGWVAMVQHYFASAWLVNAPQPRSFQSKRAGPNHYTISMVLPLGEVAPGASKAHESTLFAGPQEEFKLEALAPGLDLVKDYGYFKVLAKPLFWLLHKLHGFIGNWGWAIVALVVLLKIAFYWLNASAYRSMAKMKAINPRVMELRERHKDNPQQMQQEMMRIYREEKVNPLGGCLPILVQMPFFIALYWVLLSSVEMRNAPWIGWIHDLAAPDPWFILPVLMTASSLFQVWLNPTPPDPMQAKMMWFMPLAFSVMFFFFPAGLVLYWLTNNILSIAQQWAINRQLGVNK